MNKVMIHAPWWQVWLACLLICGTTISLISLAFVLLAKVMGWTTECP